MTPKPQLVRCLKCKEVQHDGAGKLVSVQFRVFGCRSCGYMYAKYEER